MCHVMEAWKRHGHKFKCSAQAATREGGHEGAASVRAFMEAACTVHYPHVQLYSPQCFREACFRAAWSLSPMEVACMGSSETQCQWLTIAQYTASMLSISPSACPGLGSSWQNWWDGGGHGGADNEMAKQCVGCMAFTSAETRVQLRCRATCRSSKRVLQSLCVYCLQGQRQLSKVEEECHERVEGIEVA